MVEETLLMGKEARRKLLQGINKVADAVKGTLGPSAKTVIIQQEDSFPLILNDGVSVARAVNDPDPYVQMGIDLIKQVAEQAQGVSGDGTTTATVIAQALCNEGFKEIEDGRDRIELFEMIQEKVGEIIRNIEGHSQPCETVDDVSSVAKIAANNDQELGDLIADVMLNIGSEGAIALKHGSGFETTFEIKDGLEIQSGAVSPHFSQEMANANVLITTDKINNFESLVPALELSLKEQKGLLIVCADYNESMLPNLLINVVQGKINACLVKLPSMGKQQEDWANDIRAVTGGKVFSKTLGDSLTTVKESELGYATIVQCGKDSCVVETDTGIDDAHLDDLYQQADNADHDWDKQTLTRRIARLTKGVASIYVGATTEIEMLEKKERIDDAINAVRAAMRTGTIPGGGILLNYYGVDSKDDMIMKAFSAPMRTIAENASIDLLPTMHVERGLDARTGKLDADLVAVGIIDPVDITINSIRSAVSIAKLVLLSDALVALPNN